MGKRKTSQTSHPKIDGETKTNDSHSYALRPRNQRPSYEETSDYQASETESGGSKNDSPTENTSSCAQIAIETEGLETNADLLAREGRFSGQSGRTVETEPVDSDADRSVGNTSEDLTARGRRSIKQIVCGAGRGGEDIKWGLRGRRSRTTRRKETTQSLTMEKAPTSNEGQSEGIFPQQVRLSCKKTILSWLVDAGFIKEGEQVYYKDNPESNATMTGRITRGGVICKCCKQEISIWKFEEHAKSDLRQPYKHIYLLREDTRLEDCLIAAWQNSSERERRTMFSFVAKANAPNQNDDACSICGDVGDLICCEKCPSTYHPSCMNMEGVPYTDWLCPYCTCKYCGLGGVSKDFITCYQCDKQFHFRCFKTVDLNRSRLYCGPGCREICEKLEGSLGMRNDAGGSYSWRVAHAHQMDMSCNIENNPKVAVAWMLMNEAFETITDRSTGINVVQSTVYSCRSNLNRINFSRFYTFFLEKDDEIIAAASIRLHGREIAEMPFIATDEAYRGQGICQLLMRVIESFLCDLEVEKLIIPSTSDTVGMWKRKYNFNVVNIELKRTISSYNILMLPRAIQLYKDLFKGIIDGARGGDNELDETDIQNVPVPHLAEVESPPQTDIRNDPIPQPAEVERSPQTDIRNGQEPQPRQARRPIPFPFDLNTQPDD